MSDQTEAIEIVQTFLRYVEARDLGAASGYLADNVTITFPGGRTFTSLDDQVASSAGRFRSVTKTFEGFDVAVTAIGSIVYVFGTLSGWRLDDTPFDGVRFIDRFVIVDGRITDQRVWNDIAESGVLVD